MRIAFIGVGTMGHGMAASLVRAGHEVRAFDLDADALTRVQAVGVAVVPDVATAMAGADVVVTMLPSSAAVRAVYEGQVFAAASAPILIDCSTIDVATARALNAQAAALGLLMVDAPVSGGMAAAMAGTLTFMVGGSEAAFERAKPVLAAMAKAVVHVGEAGAGQAAKLCNNMLLAISMIGTCEAFGLAKKLGLDPQRFFEVAAQSSGQCWALTSYCPEPGLVPAAPSNRDYAPGFTAALMLKDLTLAQEAALAVGAATPLGAQAKSLYTLLNAHGGGDRDFSIMARWLAGTLH